MTRHSLDPSPKRWRCRRFGSRDVAEPDTHVEQRDAAMSTDRPPAPPDLVRTVPQILPIGETPPERYVALHAHGWLAASFLTYTYPDPELDAYVRRVDELMRDRDNHDLLHQAWLTPVEYRRANAEVRRMTADDYEL